MNCIILGSGSDIAQDLMPLLRAEHEVIAWRRGQVLPRYDSWDLLLIMSGRVAPVGTWDESIDDEWKICFDANALAPVRYARNLLSKGVKGASICFMAGSNPQKIMPGYAPYNASKMALLKIVEQLDFETPDIKFFALGPGYVDTKIHKPTLEANWPNERIAKGNPTPIEKIYDCLKWAIAQPKEVIGGRNICVSDPYGPELAERLKANFNLFKLRRIE